jgi:hypothetical protein
MRTGGDRLLRYAAFLVRAALVAEALRAFFPRFAAAFFAWLESAWWLAVDRGLRLSAFEVARERRADTLLPRFFDASVSSAAFFRVVGDAEPFGAGSFTPARRAFESPIAIAC